MKLRSTLRTISLVCYSLTFLQGMIIAIPFILVLTLGLVDQEPTARLFLLLADLGLIILVVLRFRKKSRLTIALEGLVYFMLLAPLVRVLVIFPAAMFSFVLFWIPFGGFVILYPVSVVLTWLEYKSDRRIL